MPIKGHVYTVRDVVEHGAGRGMSALDAIVIVFAGLGGALAAVAAAYGFYALWTVATSWWRR